MMLRLIYFSTARLGLDRAELEALLAAAAAHNRAVGITGLLLFNGLNFLQVLEGPAAAVEALFGRIVEDPRHSGVALLKREPIEAPSYPQWGMKLKEIEALIGLQDPLRRAGQIADAMIEASRGDMKSMIEAFLSLSS
jgi:hypothetical protein